MAGKLLRLLPLVAALQAVSWSQTMIEYGGSSAMTSSGISKAAGATGKAMDGLGRRLGDSLGNTRSEASAPAHPAPAHPKLSSSPDDPMRANRQILEQGARENGALLHVTSMPPGATLFVDHRAIARAPADLRLSAGKHTLALKLPAYLDWNQEVSVSAGEKLSFEPKLQENKQAQSDKRIVYLPF